MVQTLNFLVPSLHPNTLIDLSFPSPSLGLVPSAPEPVVQHLPIKYGEYQPLGRSVRMVRTGEDQVVTADDRFQISTLDLSPLAQEEASPPVVKAQESVKARKKDIWAGLVGVQGGVISALTSGLLTYHPASSSSDDTPSASTSRTRSVPSPVQCLTSTSASPNTFVTAGKEVDVSIWDIERTFGSSGMDEDGPSKNWDSGKRKKNVYEVGQIWQAKNVPQNNLSLRQPINHLSLTYLNDSPYLLVSGTKAGTIRRYDTRQRKPLSDWKVAREGGIGCVASGVEHELFLSDQSNLLSSLDLRTGKPLYTYSQMTCTPHHLLPIPLSVTELEGGNTGSRRVGLGSISSDATFRLHTSTTPPSDEQKGNFGGEGKKGEILKMVGGVGVGEGIWRGYVERTIVPPKADKEAGEGDEEEVDDEQVWEEMNEVQDQGKDLSDNEEYSDSEESDMGEEDRVVIKSKSKKKARKI